MLDSIIEKLGSVLSENELDFMISKLANPETTWIAGNGPLEGAKGPDADQVPKPARFNNRGLKPAPKPDVPEHSVAEPTPDPSGEHLDDAAPTQGSAPAPEPGPDAAPKARKWSEGKWQRGAGGISSGETEEERDLIRQGPKPRVESAVDDAMGFVEELPDRASNAVSGLGDNLMAGANRLMEGDAKGLYQMARGAAGSAVPRELSSRLSPAANENLKSLMAMGIPAATAAGILLAVFSSNKKKKDSEGLPSGLAKLQAARDLDVYIWAYLKDNGVIN